MKSLITALVIAAVIIVGGAYCSERIDGLMGEMEKKSDRIAENVKSEDYEAAKSILSEIEEALDADAAVLASYLDHNELDKMETAIAQLAVYLDENERVSALAGVNTLKNLFERVPKDYRIRLENIF